MPLNDQEEKTLKGGRPYNMSVQTYSRPGVIQRQRGCFAFMFTNVGDVPAQVNDIRVFPNIDPVTLAILRGDSVSVGGHLLDLYKGNINLKFETPTAGVAPLVEIVQLFYTDLEK